ncbi:TIGR01906 family membrane protein [Clostridium sp. Cult1]|uniref:TIGR01906 family membrane protein n=1 Tax=Clostridium sp. Cult1 TaxID=2079002 RepID=UPI001F1DE6DB|nr:TIGR01906 family membrane protein [Clostridium sp. Cult1]MCF6464076.1 TIGR01906 family membrane protein [Clostridium sp. Cult1]
MKKILVIILMITLPFCFLLYSIEVNTFNKNIFLKSYDKHNITHATEKSKEELEEITEIILDYLKEDLDGQVLSPYFNQKEIRHMEDVQLLFKYGFFLKKITFILSILAIGILQFKGKWKSLGISMFYGPFIWHGLFLLLLIFSMIDFNKYFTYFHVIFFDNDLWLLNPKTDLLIQMLPEEFFISIFIRIILLFLSILAIIQIIGYMLIKKGKDNNGYIIKF